MVSRRDIMKSGAGALIASAVGPATVFAQAADYPNKPIHTICMFPPGSGADILVRFFATVLRHGHLDVVCALAQARAAL